MAPSLPKAAATAGLIKDREAEVAGLAEAARELAARSDDGATIGKLQSALLATQVRRGSGPHPSMVLLFEQET